MDRYMIESPHTVENCTMVIKEVESMGYLHHFDWGCEDGVHVGWAIIEADTHAQARLVVPSLVRKDARAVRLVKFTGKRPTGPGEPEGGPDQAD